MTSKEFEVEFKGIFIRKKDDDTLRIIYPPFEAIISLKDFLAFLEKNVGSKEVEVEDNKIIVKGGQKDPKDYIYYYFDTAFRRSLVNMITGRQTLYIDESLEIPLIGSHYFGLIDRGTNLIQVRPITGCNMKCIYCSVSEGPGKDRLVDYVIDYEFLIKEYEKIVEFKGRHAIEAHIDGQGEPMMYPWIVDLVQELKDVKGTEIISIQTNGYRLTEKMISDLESAGLSRVNLSVDSLRDDKIKLINGVPVSSNFIKKIIEAIVNSNIRLLVAPLWIPGINDDDIIEIIEYVLSLKPKSEWPIFGIQKYIPYAMGRKPKVKVMTFHKFYAALRRLEKKYGVKLVLSPKDFGIHKRKSLPKVFNLHEKVWVRTVLPGRLPNEVIGVARNRLVEITEFLGDLNTKVRVEILRNKDNIYVARAL
ncbi:MAG: radical SAM protein [Euryarchaeota archaeon]|nr:radical SAM protein [Euryarchaeota archaeon]